MGYMSPMLVARLLVVVSVSSTIIPVDQRLGSQSSLSKAAVTTRANWRAGKEQPVDTTWRSRVAMEIAGPQDGSGFQGISAIGRDSLGHFFVADRDGLHMTGSNGKYIRRIAPPGRGPGEVLWVTGLVGVVGGGVWAVDYANRRYSFFNGEGRFMVSRPRQLSPLFVPWPGGSFGDGFIDFDREPVANGMRPIAIKADSTWLPRVRLPLPMDPDTHVPFAPALVFRSGSDAIWFGTSEHYRLLRVTMNGDTTETVTGFRDPQPITAAERDTAYVRWRSRVGEIASGGARGSAPMRFGSLPRRKPYFHGLVPLTDGGLGVLPIVAAEDQDRVMDLFGGTGRFRGPVRLPYEVMRHVAVVATREGLVAAMMDANGEEHVYVVRFVPEPRFD